MIWTEALHSFSTHFHYARSILNRKEHFRIKFLVLHVLVSRHPNAYVTSFSPLNDLAIISSNGSSFIEGECPVSSIPSSVTATI